MLCCCHWFCWCCRVDLRCCYSYHVLCGCCWCCCCYFLFFVVVVVVVGCAVDVGIFDVVVGGVVGAVVIRFGVCFRVRIFAAVVVIAFIFAIIVVVGVVVVVIIAVGVVVVVHVVVVVVSGVVGVDVC